jgi:hypothetical protein
LNAMSLKNTGKPGDDYRPGLHSRSGSNFRKEARMSGVFVLGWDGEPLTPTTNTKARKLMKGGAAKPVWNKFGQMGVQLLVGTRKEVPMMALGVDLGTKFEGYSVVSEKMNNLNVMWKLPDKKKIVRKLTERRVLRRARRHRMLRSRSKRVDNRERKGFIAPSQNVIVQSRLKAMQEIFRCYPIQKVALEDVTFNHAKKRYGANFSTMELGKTKLYGFLREKVGNDNLVLFQGNETYAMRKAGKLKKTAIKSAEKFSSHCVDSFAIAREVIGTEVAPRYTLISVDDSYRPVRRKLHYAQPAKEGVRKRYSTGNFKGIRKGSICQFGQIVGGTKNWIYYRDFTKVLQKGKVLSKLGWVSKRFKARLCA